MDKYTRAKLLGTGHKAGDLPLDRLTGAMPVIQAFERDIHEGCGWEFFHVARDVAKDGEVLVQLNTGAAGFRLRRLVAWTDASLALLELLRHPMLTSGTLGVPIQNLNHAVERELPEGIAAFSDPGDVEGGEICHKELLGGGKEIALSSKAWASECDTGSVLAADSIYLIRITNMDEQPRNFSVRGFFCA